MDKDKKEYDDFVEMIENIEEQEVVKNTDFKDKVISYTIYIILGITFIAFPWGIVVYTLFFNN